MSYHLIVLTELPRESKPGFYLINDLSQGELEYLTKLSKDDHHWLYDSLHRFYEFLNTRAIKIRDIKLNCEISHIFSIAYRY
jgi:hypothetical protein